MQTQRASASIAPAPAAGDIALHCKLLGLEVPRGVAIHLPNDPRAVEYIDAFLVRCVHASASQVDQVILDGGDAEAFAGAVLLMQQGVIRMRGTAADTDWPSMLAQRGVEPAPNAEGLSLRTRFSLLRDVGIPLDQPRGAMPSLLVSAVEAENLPALNALIETGANPHIIEYGRTLAHVALDAGADGMLGALAVLGVSTPVTPTNRDSDLLAAAFSGDIAAVSAALRAGANLNAADDAGTTALHHAARRNDAALVRFLGKQPGIDFDAEDGRGLTPLQCAVLHNKLDAVRALLACPGINPNRPRFDGSTAMHIAAYGGFGSSLEALLEHPNIDPNLPMCDGQTPLHLATRRGHRALVSSLSGRSDVAANASSSEGSTVLHVAASSGSSGMIKTLSSIDGLDVNASTTSGLTPLHVAVQEGRMAQVRDLLACPGVDLNRVNAEGKAALHLAAERNRPDILRALLIRPGIDVNATTPQGNTALHIAVASGSRSAVDYLLAHPKIARNKRNNDGATARRIARDKGLTEIVRALTPPPVWKRWLCLTAR